MLFSLEALRARFGDSLIVHFGANDKPRLIVIDGGPSGVCNDALAPRLDQLRERLADDGPLPIEIVMVSHIDSDHVRGLVDLTEQLVEQEQHELPYRVKTLWHNAFDEAIGGDVATLRAEVEQQAELRGASAVLESVAEGEQLQSNATTLGWPLNKGFDDIVMAPAEGGRTVDLGELKLTVICPLQPQVDALRKKWQAELEKLKQEADPAAIAEYLDRSVYNLSSIVCLAELGGRRMLLTGDARGDHILTGLEAANLVEKGGKLELDLLKLPHHGSDRNVDLDFFERLPARHYVASGDGGYGNPELATFELISKARSDDEFTIHLTYEHAKDGVGEKLASFFAAERDKDRGYEVAYRPDDALSLTVDLLDEVGY